MSEKVTPQHKIIFHEEFGTWQSEGWWFSTIKHWTGEIDESGYPDCYCGKPSNYLHEYGPEQPLTEGNCPECFEYESPL